MGAVFQEESPYLGDREIAVYVMENMAALALKCEDAIHCPIFDPDAFLLENFLLTPAALLEHVASDNSDDSNIPIDRSLLTDTNTILPYRAELIFTSEIFELLYLMI